MKNCKTYYLILNLTVFLVKKRKDDSFCGIVLLSELLLVILELRDVCVCKLLLLLLGLLLGLALFVLLILFGSCVSRSEEHIIIVAICMAIVKCVICSTNFLSNWLMNVSFVFSSQYVSSSIKCFSLNTGNKIHQVKNSKSFVNSSNLNGKKENSCKYQMINIKFRVKLAYFALA